MVRGETLDLRQEDITQSGHAIECRIYAEDPLNGFLPSSGRITLFRGPAGPGVRHDCGIYEGWEVPVHYDPILSKLIVHAGDREAARQRMLRALSETTILGIETTVEYLKAIIENPAFASGDTQTDFVEKHMSEWDAGSDAAGDGPGDGADELADVAAIAGAISLAASTTAGPRTKTRAASPWDTLGGWRVGGGS